MGQRANLVSRNSDGWTLHYSHWAAGRLDVDLFWGPEHSKLFIESQRRVDPDDWLNTISCEGAALLDTDESVLLWWGGEDILWDVPLRRVLLDLMASVWAGWEIRWAHRGILDIVAACGMSAELVQTNSGLNRSANQVWCLDLRPAWADAAVTLTRRGNIEIYPCSGSWLDEDLFPSFTEVDGGLLRHPVERLRFADGTFPLAGVHADFDTRRIRFWYADPHPQMLELVTRRWEGWTVLCDGDSFEAQLQECQGRLEIPERTRIELVQSVVNHIERMSGYDQSGAETTERYRQLLLATNPGRSVTMSPLVGDHVAVPVDEATRRRVLDIVKSIIEH